MNLDIILVESSMYTYYSHVHDKYAKLQFIVSNINR